MSDEKKNGHGDGSRNGYRDEGDDAVPEPAGGIIIPGPDTAADRVSRLRRALDVADGIGERLERRLRRGGFDRGSIPDVVELADYLEGVLPERLGATARCLRLVVGLHEDSPTRALRALVSEAHKIRSSWLELSTHERPLAEPGIAVRLRALARQIEETAAEFGRRPQGA